MYLCDEGLVTARGKLVVWSGGTPTVLSSLFRIALICRLDVTKMLLKYCIDVERKLLVELSWVPQCLGDEVGFDLNNGWRHKICTGCAIVVPQCRVDAVEFGLLYHSVSLTKWVLLGEPHACLVDSVGWLNNIWCHKISAGCTDIVPLESLVDEVGFAGLDRTGVELTLWVGCIVPHGIAEAMWCRLSCTTMNPEKIVWIFDGIWCFVPQFISRKRSGCGFERQDHVRNLTEIERSCPNRAGRQV
jgi:hypothetical protein